MLHTKEGFQSASRTHLQLGLGHWCLQGHACRCLRQQDASCNQVLMLACNAAMLGYCVQARAHARASVAEQVVVCVRGLETAVPG